jgi:hypothetical protein
MLRPEKAAVQKSAGILIKNVAAMHATFARLCPCIGGGAMLRWCSLMHAVLSHTASMNHAPTGLTAAFRSV